MTAGLSAREGRRGRVARLEPDTLARIALGLLLVGAGAFLLHATRGTTLWFDEWQWALDRRANDLDAFLEPHNQHLSLVPIAVYKLLFATAGLDHYGAYRVVGIGAHLVCVLLLFVYASRRVGSMLALLAAAVMVFLGPAWQNFLWPFQVGWLIALGAGLGALLLLDRRDRAGDVAASVLLGVSVASSGIGLPIALGLLVDVLWGRRRWRDAWIVALPLALYALWWLVYQDSNFASESIPRAPGFVADAAAAALSSLVGLGGRFRIGSESAVLEWGRPLAVVAVPLLLWQLSRLRPIPPRVLALLVTAGTFWLLTALARGQYTAVFANPIASRYVYVGGFFILLLVVELARGYQPSRRAVLVLTAVVLAAVVSNIDVLNDGGRYLREQAEVTRARLGALDIARPVAEPDYVANMYFGVIRAGPYFAVADADGTPALSPAQLARAPERLHAEADDELIRVHGIALRSSRPDVPRGQPPHVDHVAGGTATERGPCVAFRPADSPTAGGPTPDLHLALPSGGAFLRAEGGAATVSVRRFARGFRADETLAPDAPSVLRIRPDRVARPWHLRVMPTDRVSVCGLG